MFGWKFFVLFFVGTLVSEISSEKVKELAKQYETRLKGENNQRRSSYKDIPREKRLSVGEMVRKIDKRKSNQIISSSGVSKPVSQMPLEQQKQSFQNATNCQSNTSTSSNQIKSNPVAPILETISIPQGNGQPKDSRQLAKSAAKKPIDLSYKYTLDDLFKKAQQNEFYLNNISDGNRYELYALRMQATVGDCKTARPQSKGVAEWGAWNHKKGTKQETAKRNYVNKVKDLVRRVGLR